MAFLSFLKALLAASVISTVAALPAESTDALKLKLSPSAAIYFPGSDGYKTATTRWSGETQPGLDLVVKVASEADVQATVKYANDHSIPFLAINGGHGTSTYLNNIKHGIGIYMRGLSGVSLSPSNSSQAVILGGSSSGEVIAGLKNLNKQSVTGGCSCTGFTSPMLGGGHGWLQGRYGLITDQLISARVVLANGTAISVDSTKNPDLYWGLKGAGHNFGIVTSVNFQVYDSTPDIDGFATATYTFTQDKLEAVFSIANQWLAAKNRPVELTHYGIFASNPTVDTKNPVIVFLVYWQGSGEIPTQYTQPLEKLNPVNIVKKHVDLLEANAITGASEDGPACARGNARQTFPVDLDKWDTGNLRKVMDIFTSFPPALNNSAMLLEGFATNRVLEIPAASTAYPFRGQVLLASPLFTYPAGNRQLDAQVAKLGQQIRTTLLRGTGLGLRAYVNYANGDEDQRAVFGYEPWRLDRLRALKKSYDPQGRFNFYGPIKV